MNAPVGLGVKIPMMLVSFALSFFMWIGIQLNQPSGYIQVDMPIGALGVEKLQDRYVLPDLGTVSVRIDGPQDQLPDQNDKKAVDQVLRQCRAAVFVDFSQGVYVGLHSYQLNLEYLHNQPFTLSLGHATVMADIEPLSKDVPMTISVDVAGQLPKELENMRFTTATTDPKSVTLSGPTPDVAQVKRVRVLLDLGSITDPKKVFGTPELLDEDDHPLPQTVQNAISVDPNAVQVLPALVPAAQTQTVRVQPVIIGHPAAGFQQGNSSVEPNQVVVQGPPDVLAQLQAIDTAPVNLNGVRSSATYEEPLQLPPGVTALGTKTVRIKVTIIPTGQKAVPNSSAVGPP